ncbi:MAG: 1,4-dihydroxy-2-naphthoate polyprenyltransferase [Candidatus Nanopelagicales bacterium]|nr:1,4-dihydroxy-2-naphthoate polyprenyltransferase [Candidatus Nanopelagicales bacterium]
MATTAQWIAGTRPRTLPAAVVPVAVGAAVAYFLNAPLGGFAFGFRTALALIVSLALQVGVNYANDYSDGIRGTDEVRVGPVRLVGQQLAKPGEVKRAALASFAVAGLAGLALVLLTGAWWLLLVGACAIVAAWFYTGGPRPYGYAGLGELFVFVFFGLVAVAGTTFVLTGRIEFLAVVMAVPIGLFACALLIINNLRDIPGDTAVGKRTLAVRIGDQQTRALYGIAIGLPFAIAVVVGFAGIAFESTFPAGALIAVIALPFALAPWKTVRSGALGPDLIPVLAATGRLQLAYGLLLTVGIFASR